MSSSFNIIPVLLPIKRHPSQSKVRESTKELKHRLRKVKHTLRWHHHQQLSSATTEAAAADKRSERHDPRPCLCFLHRVLHMPAPPPPPVEVLLYRQNFGGGHVRPSSADDDDEVASAILILQPHQYRSAQPLTMIFTATRQRLC